MIGLILTFTVTIQAEDNVTSPELKTFLEAHPTLNTPEMITLLKNGEKEAEEEAKLRKVEFGKAKFYRYLGKAFVTARGYLFKGLTRGTPKFMAELTEKKYSFGRLALLIEAKRKTAEAKRKTAKSIRMAEISKMIVKSVKK